MFQGLVTDKPECTIFQVLFRLNDTSKSSPFVTAESPLVEPKQELIVLLHQNNAASQDPHSEITTKRIMSRLIGISTEKLTFKFSLAFLDFLSTTLLHHIQRKLWKYQKMLQHGDKNGAPGPLQSPTYIPFGPSNARVLCRAQCIFQRLK